MRLVLSNFGIFVVRRLYYWIFEEIQIVLRWMIENSYSEDCDKYKSKKVCLPKLSPSTSLTLVVTSHFRLIVTFLTVESTIEQKLVFSPSYPI